MRPLFIWTLMMVSLAAFFEITPSLAAPSENLNLSNIEKRHYELVDKASEILNSKGDWNEAKELLQEARGLRVITSKGDFPYRPKDKAADYYYAWILCQKSTTKSQGLEILNTLLHNDMLPAKKLAKVKEQRAKCDDGSSSKSSPDELFKDKDKFALFVIQKGGKWSQQVLLQSKHALPNLPWEQRKDAEAAIKKDFKHYNQIEARPFLVAGTFKKTYLMELANTVLLPYYNYITKSLGIEYDWGTIYVFVVNSHEQFASTTKQLYHMTSDDTFAVESAIAFSDPPNKMMIAICGKEASNCTSFAHEIFHILNSKIFEDAPWWLYEGTAELFESGEILNGTFRAQAGWRKDKANMDKLDPKSFHELLNISKNDPSLYNPPGNEIAMSRVRFFCRYLHEKDKLWPIYNDLRKRGLSDAVMDPGGIAVIEKKLNKSINEVNFDFRKWFRQVVNSEPSTHGP